MAESGKPRVFVSHHHSPEEDLFTRRLVLDLTIAGADVWVDEQRVSSDNFVRKISEGMEGRQWVVLIMTPNSVASPWVRNEIDTALNEVTFGRMLGVIPLVMTLTPDQDIPLLWRPLHRYDATKSYEQARDGLLRALSLNPPTPSQWPGLPQLALQSPSASSPSSDQASQSLSRAPTGPLASAMPTPRFPAPALPARLASLGYMGMNINGRPVYIPPLVTIPGGSFLMGSDQTRDALAHASETPLQWVDTPSFQIARYPVTVTEYTLAVRAGALPEPGAAGSGAWQAQLQKPDHPVTGVTWANALTYIAWLREATGLPGWRLPTEAEWEKAARWDLRANASRMFPWGDAFDKERCNTRESETKGTLPVGSYAPGGKRKAGASSAGAEDMAGNVYEWTGTLARAYPYKASDGREDAQAQGERVLRGGSWSSGKECARAAHRLGKDPAQASSDVGFRLAMSLPSV